MKHCKKCGLEILDDLFCTNCSEPAELDKKIWDIYSLLLIKGVPIHPEAPGLPLGSHEMNYQLKRMKRIGIVRERIDGSFELDERKDRYVILTHLLFLDRRKFIRLSFYLAFSATFFLLFVLYYKFLPRDPSTSSILIFIFMTFSVVAFALEILKNQQLIMFYYKVLRATSLPE